MHNCTWGIFLPSYKPPSIRPRFLFPIVLFIFLLGYPLCIFRLDKVVEIDRLVRSLWLFEPRSYQNFTLLPIVSNVYVLFSVFHSVFLWLGNIAKTSCQTLGVIALIIQPWYWYIVHIPWRFFPPNIHRSIFFFHMLH